mmetsp:Transcript_2150/g.4166  ORF Transcript_2150/g.4166 Transcript_2150/m.4166 type:complete len:171 (+) Transcript_2150:55-567(+)
MQLARQLRPVGPHKLLGTVVTGFKRGSKQLGWPTANLDPAAFENTLDSEEEGVYVGWAAIEGSGLPPAARVVHKAVLSIGWNPTFGNEKRTVEAYLCHEFEHDFYGASMRLIVCGYVRPQENFFKEGVAYEAAMATLIEAIANDVEFGKTKLDTVEMLAFRSDAFFTDPR